MSGAGRFGEMQLPVVCRAEILKFISFLVTIYPLLFVGIVQISQSQTVSMRVLIIFTLFVSPVVNG